MEFIVSILVGLIGAGATIIAAYIQANRSNLHSATEKRALNREMSVTILASPQNPEASTVILKDKKSSKAMLGNGEMLSIQARPAFLDDLGCEPTEGEILLFLRAGRFKSGHPDNRWHKGWIVVTNRRVVCRRYARLGSYEGWTFEFYQFTHEGGVLADGNMIRPSRVRLQDRKTVLLETEPFDQLFMQVNLGLFESADKVLHVLIATIQVAAKGK